MSAKARYTATPAQILRSLCGIEQWLKGIRKVIAQMPQDMEIELTEHLPDFQSGGGNMPYVKGCPPPDIYEDGGGGMIKVKNCPPPDWYQDECP